MDQPKKSIGEVVRDFRVKRGMTVSLLGNSSGVSKGLISDLENNNRDNLSIDTLAKIAGAMSTRASVLLRTMEQANQ